VNREGARRNLECLVCKKFACPYIQSSQVVIKRYPVVTRLSFLADRRSCDDDSILYTYINITLLVNASRDTRRIVAGSWDCRFHGQKLSINFYLARSVNTHQQFSHTHQCCAQMRLRYDNRHTDIPYVASERCRRCDTNLYSFACIPQGSFIEILYRQRSTNHCSKCIAKSPIRSWRA
jgi:hypothetical protein